MKCLVFFSFTIIITAFATDNTPLADQYIRQYKAIAVSEMQRTGIPASIKLAQGLLESDWGRSNLATEGNNHFGIKCGSDWTGNSFYKEDDDRDQKGKLIASCFRSFDDPYESYIAHSDFLTRNNKQSRYGFLFDLPSDDYRAWARGLQKSGYATDPNYPKKLVTIIEKYELFRFDQKAQRYANNYSSNKYKPKNTSRPKTHKQVDPQNKIIQSKDKLLKINGIQAIKLAQESSLAEISKKYKKHASSLIRNNYFITLRDQIIPSDSIIYLSRKPSKYQGNLKQHKVSQGETIAFIAHKYGVSESYLRRINKLNKRAILDKDLSIHLVKVKGNTSSKRRTKAKSRRNKKTENREEYLFDKGWAKR